MPIITLMTDFQERDHYVASMKGIIARIAPRATLIDISHQIGHQSVIHGAFVLRETVPWFPADTIHVAVVDPGVGTERRVIAIRIAGQLIIAPDNGLVSMLHHNLPVQELRVVENPRWRLPAVTNTFHGRDIMAPAAAHLANGAKFHEIGPVTDRLEALSLARVQWTRERNLTGAIIHVDAFGNLITNITRQDLVDLHRDQRERHVFLDDSDVGPLRRTYADVAPQQPLALIGSSDLLEISVNQGSAAELFRAGVGQAIHVR